MRSKALTITITVLTVLYLASAAGAYHLLRYRDPIEEINKRKPEYEYVEVRRSGSITGHYDKGIKVYQQDGKYYISDLDKGEIVDTTEITKTEYILCTDIDPEALSNAKNVAGSDLIYDEVVYKKNGEEEQHLKPKCYYFAPLATAERLHTQANEKTQGQLDKDTYLKLDAYVKTRDIGWAYLRIKFMEDDEIVLEDYPAFVKIDPDIDPQEYKETTLGYGSLSSDSVGAKIRARKEELLKICEEKEFRGEKAYYIENFGDSFVLFNLGMPESHSYVIFYCKKTDKTKAQRYFRDIQSILSGEEPDNRDMFIALAAESGVYAILLTASVIIFRRNGKAESTIETSDEAVIK